MTSSTTNRPLSALVSELASPGTADQSPHGSALSVDAPYVYVTGALFPSNVITSSSIRYNPLTKTYTGSERLGSLQADLSITTAPVKVPGMNRYLSEWFIPQMIDVANSNSLFNAVLQAVIGQYTKKTRANSIANLRAIGYTGLFADQAANSDAYFSQLGGKDDQLYKEIQKIGNYDPAAVWRGYDPLTDDNLVFSNADIDALRRNLEALDDPAAVPNPPYWYPSILYSYQASGQPTSIPGPALLLRPGEDLNIRFTNDIQLGDLTPAEQQQSTYVPISTYGNTASSGLGGVTTTNFHLHGMHINPEGFGDNVVARYTTGQAWTTLMNLSKKQAVGSYWYHPHYHPSVNGQLYGGLAGFLELGDTLGKIPAFTETPRNLVQLKNLQLGFQDGEVSLSGYDNGLPVNQMVMTTVNGEFQPAVDAGAGGWQSFSLSNMTNNMSYNIAFSNAGSSLPIYIYGEDGHQLPQIRWSSHGALGNQSANPGNGNPNNTPTIAYAQADNLIALAPGKRVDVLVYLPEGSTEINSFYSFRGPSQSGASSVNYNILNIGTYPDLSSSNTIGNASDPYNLGQLGPGQLATLTVNQAVPVLSKAQQDEVIRQANAGITVQEVLPTTTASQINPQAVQSIDLFAKTASGDDLWRPIRQREFNWARGTLVGPASDYDAATQQELARIEALPEFQARNYQYKRYRPLPLQGLLNGLGTSNFLTAPTSWLGYDNPFLINDHVFPNGNLTIAQIGTVEQWTLANWSVAAVGRNSSKSVSQSNQYIGHPFHIHINDYQVKNSDTELQNKRNLEDVTMINSSGYKYFNLSADPISGEPIGIVEKAPLQGDLITIEEAQRAETVGELATYGANTQTVKMMFQDYLGTYVFHCHILPHEDAGMMQAVMVVDNTKSSWLVAAEAVPVRRRKSAYGPDGARVTQELNVRLARDLAPYQLQLRTRADVRLERFQVGDLNRDFVQDILVASSGDGAVRVLDGQALLHDRRTVVSSRFTPYAGVSLAPWAFVEDFNGDADREIVTGGFAPEPGVSRPPGTVTIHDFTIKGWIRGGQVTGWQEAFALSPWQLIPHHHVLDAASGAPQPMHADLNPVAGLTAAQTGFAMGDFNLDNFVDYAMAYAVAGGLRITILDGAAVALALQTGSFEGGYDPNTALLADALLLDPSLSSLRRVVLTNGFNGYAQLAIENLLVTAQTDQGTQLFSLALDAGHFIATSEPADPGTAEAGHHGHAASGSHPLDADHVINLEATNYPLHLQSIDRLPESVVAATPVFSGALANGSLLAGDQLLIAQGNGANGSDSTSDQLIDTAQQLVIPLDRLRRVDADDLIGITTSTPETTFSAEQVAARNNLVNLVYTAYTGGLVSPGLAAFWSAASLGQGDSAAELVAQFVADPLTGQLVEQQFGGPLESQSVSRIVETTCRSLYGRSASGEDLIRAELAIAAGLAKTDLPLQILQSTSGVDRFRVGLLSAYSQWSNAQWGTDANVVGSYGQGFQSDQADFDQLQAGVQQLGVLPSWQSAQLAYDALQAGSIDLIRGTEISPTGNF